jgi:hypothetical protein
MQLDKDFAIKELKDITNKKSQKQLEKYNTKNDGTKINQDINTIFRKKLTLLNIGEHERFSQYNNLATIGMLSLAPYSTSGYQLCKYAGDCKEFCHGHNINKDFIPDNKYLESISDKSQLLIKTLKTIAFMQDKEKFMELLSLEICKWIETNENPVIRLNGYSDIEWEKIRFKLDTKIYNSIKNKFNNIFGKNFLYTSNFTEKINCILNDNIINSNNLEKYNIFELFSGLLFYDYTKYSPNNRISSYNNYKLVYSYDKFLDNNLKHIKKDNVICIIIDKCYKEDLFKKQKTIELENSIFLDGDLYDCRWLDSKFFNDPVKNKIILLGTVDGSKKGYKYNVLQSSKHVIKKEEDLKEILQKLNK